MEDKEKQAMQEEVVDNLVKKYTELEKQVMTLTKLETPVNDEGFEHVIRELGEIKTLNRNVHALVSKTGNKQIRILLFPEHDQGSYYKIIFGRLLPWALAFIICTYIFIIGYRALELYKDKAIEFYRYRGSYQDSLKESTHYQRAWLYFRQSQKKKMINEMNEAMKRTAGQ